MEESVQPENSAKSKQAVRLVDVFIFSPILIYIGLSGKLTPFWRTVLVILGISTIIYNGYYFIKYNKSNNQ